VLNGVAAFELRSGKNASVAVRAKAQMRRDTLPIFERLAMPFLPYGFSRTARERTCVRSGQPHSASKSAGSTTVGGPIRRVFDAATIGCPATNAIDTRMIGQPFWIAARGRHDIYIGVPSNR